MNEPTYFRFLIGRGDMRGAADAYLKKGAHGGNMVSPVQGDMRGAADAYMKKGAHGGNMVSPVRVER